MQKICYQKVATYSDLSGREEPNWLGWVFFSEKMRFIGPDLTCRRSSSKEHVLSLQWSLRGINGIHWIHQMIEAAGSSEPSKTFTCFDWLAIWCERHCQYHFFCGAPSRCDTIRYADLIVVCKLCMVRKLFGSLAVWFRFQMQPGIWMASHLPQAS